MQFRLDGSRVVFDVHEKVQAWFSTRRGGVSFPPFDTLNLSYGVGDLKPAVTENRRRMLASAGRRLEDLVMPHQVHESHIAWVDADMAGRGSEGAQPIPSTDGFLTDSREVVLGLGFADCVPIFVTDVDARAVGLLHAGWRGTAAEIQVRGVEMLRSRGIEPHDLLIGLGPAIGSCCYEVDAPVKEAVMNLVGMEPLTAVDEAHWRLNLHLANRRLLERAGVRPEHIVEAPFCTGCRRDLFFSYRVEQRMTGRMGGYICLAR